MTDKIFQEIEEEARIERIRLILKKVAPWLGLVTVLVLAGVGGWQYHSWQQYRSDAEDSAEYFKAMDLMDKSAILLGQSAPKENKAEAMAIFNSLGEKAPENMRALALLNEAALALRNADQQKALQIWLGLSAGSQGIDPLLSGMANLLWLQHMIDKAQPADLRKKINELHSRSERWATYADEFSALLSLRENKISEAKQILASLVQNPMASPGVRSRAGSLLQTLSSASITGN
ncbi:hypothetical protein [Entomobacter blattae]|uniref:Tetratricopeptide repeat-like domain-containing protein n=1 Tax=Entomobacter blattae TaxID=2762277 RepID=A0A7H1NSS0_9PROT|nr:hypothetical protein [Entomobacter blattae]QNT78830.1 hypothetical protein JGUZn3_16080 [Entomobacter blattae]